MSIFHPSVPLITTIKTHSFDLLIGKNLCELCVLCGKGMKAICGLHDKPCGILNVQGYFDGLLAFLRSVREEGFISAATLEELVVEEDVSRLLD